MLQDRRGMRDHIRQCDRADGPIRRRALGLRAPSTACYSHCVICSHLHIRVACMVAPAPRTPSHTDIFRTDLVYHFPSNTHSISTWHCYPPPFLLSYCYLAVLLLHCCNLVRCTSVPTLLDCCRVYTWLPWVSRISMYLGLVIACQKL